MKYKLKAYFFSIVCMFVMVTVVTADTAAIKTAEDASMECYTQVIDIQASNQYVLNIAQDITITSKTAEEDVGWQGNIAFTDQKTTDDDVGWQVDGVLVRNKILGHDKMDKHAAIMLMPEEQADNVFMPALQEVAEIKTKSVKQIATKSEGTDELMPEEKVAMDRNTMEKSHMLQSKQLEELVIIA